MPVRRSVSHPEPLERRAPRHGVIDRELATDGAARLNYPVIRMQLEAFWPSRRVMAFEEGREQGGMVGLVEQVGADDEVESAELNFIP